MFTPKEFRCDNCVLYCCRRGGRRRPVRGRRRRGGASVAELGEQFGVAACGQHAPLDAHRPAPHHQARPAPRRHPERIRAQVPVQDVPLGELPLYLPQTDSPPPSADAYRRLYSCCNYVYGTFIRGRRQRGLAPSGVSPFGSTRSRNYSPPLLKSPVGLALNRLARIGPKRENRRCVPNRGRPGSVAWGAIGVNLYRVR